MHACVVDGIEGEKAMWVGGSGGGGGRRRIIRRKWKDKKVCNTQNSYSQLVCKLKSILTRKQMQINVKPGRETRKENGWNTGKIYGEVI